MGVQVCNGILDITFGQRPWRDGGVFEGGSFTDDIEQSQLPLKDRGLSDRFCFNLT
jgi:hypothetical protein